jgi:sugar/nucleoside kinase (ribokinase family)
VKIACDIQDVVNLRDGYREDFIEYADIVFFSAANQPGPAPLIEDLLNWKPGLIVVSGMGAQGCALGSRDGAHSRVRYFPPVSMPAPVIDTNGAGDGLAVGFLSSYVLDGYSLEDSIRRGQIAARYTCTQQASSSHLITPDLMAVYFQKGQT